jgi:hypothetical protein
MYGLLPSTFQFVVEIISQQAQGQSIPARPQCLPSSLALALYQACESLVVVLRSLGTSHSSAALGDSVVIGVQTVANAMMNIGWQGFEMRGKQPSYAMSTTRNNFLPSSRDDNSIYGPRLFCSA